MRKRLFLPIFFISFAAVLLLFSRENAALAAMPEDGPEKGTIAAASTEIDRSTYTDGSVFENEPAKVETVKIGLRYGEDGVYSAWLVNPSGEGFLVGFYDEFFDGSSEGCDEIRSIAVSVGTDDTLNQNVTTGVNYTDFGGLASYIYSYYKLFLHN